MRGKHISTYKFLPVYSNRRALRNFRKLRHSHKDYRSVVFCNCSSSVSYRKCLHSHSVIIDTHPLIKSSIILSVVRKTLTSNEVSI